MAKNKPTLRVIPVFDGKMEASEVFADMISRKINDIKSQKNIENSHKKLYDHIKVQENRQSSGLCG